MKVKWGECKREIGVRRRTLPVVNIPKFHMLSGGMCPVATNPVFFKIIDESTQLFQDVFREATIEDEIYKTAMYLYKVEHYLLTKRSKLGLKSSGLMNARAPNILQ